MGVQHSVERVIMSKCRSIFSAVEAPWCSSLRKPSAVTELVLMAIYISEMSVNRMLRLQKRFKTHLSQDLPMFDSQDHVLLRFFSKLQQLSRAKSWNRKASANHGDGSNRARIMIWIHDSIQESSLEDSSHDSWFTESIVQTSHYSNSEPAADKIWSPPTHHCVTVRSMIG